MNKNLKLIGLTLWYAICLTFLGIAFLGILVVFVMLIGNYGLYISGACIVYGILSAAYCIAKESLKADD